MELKDICCDKGISGELKEKGFPQDGLFWWKKYPSEWDIAIDGCGYVPDKASDFLAPTAEEILKELPCFFCDENGFQYNLHLEQFRKEYCISYYNSYKIKNFNRQLFKDKKLCNALAKMWIYLKDNNLLEEKT